MTTAWIAGASGLVGGELLTLLLADSAFERVVSVGRRTLPLESPKLVQAKVDFAEPASFAELPEADVAFSCLGTTIKKAGSREAFRAVDHDAVLAFAKVAKGKGAKVLVHVSSLGANPRSSVFYSAVKGEAEADLAALGFESVYALRPSILDGDRAESRPLERVGIVVARAFGPVLGKYRPTKASAVAAAMVANAKSRAPGSHVVDAGAIR